MKRVADQVQGGRSPKRSQPDFSDTDENILIEAVDDLDKACGFRCDYCGRVLKTVENYKRHKLSHVSQYNCHLCTATFNRKDNLTAHKKKKHGITPSKRNDNVFCTICMKAFSTPGNLRAHQRTIHSTNSAQRQTTFKCRRCAEVFSNSADLLNHVNDNHTPNQSGGRAVPSPSSETIHSEENTSTVSDKRRVDDVTAVQQQVQNRIVYPTEEDKYDLLTFLASVKNDVIDWLHSRVKRTKGLKWNLCVQVDMERDSGDGTVVAASPFFRSNTYILLNEDTFSDHHLNEALQKIHASMEKYLREGSGWYLKRVRNLEIHTVVYSPLSGSSYIPLPNSLAHSHCVLNIINTDHKCFLYSVLASLHQGLSNPTCVENYVPFENDIAMRGIQYPVSLHQITSFENQNHTISVNVFGYEDKDIIPLRITSHSDRLHHVNLLLLQNDVDSHYCLITDLNRFLSRISNYKGSLHYCPYCLHGFTKEQGLQDHLPYCCKHGAQKVELPIPSQTDRLSFKEYEKTLKVPFIIYADLETVNVKLPHDIPPSDKPSTTSTTKLAVCGYGYKVVCVDPKYTKPTAVYRGQDASIKLLSSLISEMEAIQHILRRVTPMDLTDEDLDQVNNPTVCSICKHQFSPYYLAYNKPVRHHNHVTGAFIGMAHNHCNLNCQQVKHIPVIFHNLRNFDAHILCQNIGQFKSKKLTCIAQNTERYVSFSLGDLRFIDSFQFLPSSLETLTANLAQDGIGAFPHVQTEFPIRDQAFLLLRKGVYPYDYMDNVSRFEEVALPPKEEFYSHIKREGISDADYAHAQKVFETFGLRNLGDYHDLYLKTDVLLLCDVYEAFRAVCMEQYGLDCAHFYTSPGLSWAACLKMTQVQLELMSDIDQILFIEKGIRGGISQISHRFKKANNPYLDGYDPHKRTSYIQYLDMNNLYGYAMIQKLPVDSFRFLSKREIEYFDLFEMDDDDDVGYILEVSLRYPPKFHNDHNDYPLAPETKHVPSDLLSPYACGLWKKLHGLTFEDEMPPRPCIEKLLTTLDDKDKYVVHYRNLQLYLDLGMEIKEIHRILQFHQDAWMKPYIDFNTEMRKQAVSTFQKNFYKLMNCSVFGKTMENVRKHKSIELVHTERRLKKLSAKPTYKTAKIFSEDLVAVELDRHKVKLFKPSYSGMCILDLSKLAMYDFYYNHLKQQYGSSLKLLMSDTDSILFFCETDDIYKDMKQNLNLYDTSDYPDDHALHSVKNKKVLGKMKDETNGTPIAEFVGLRSKMYSFRCGGKETKRAKGISKVTVEKDLQFSHYKDILFRETQKYSRMSSIQSRNHELFCDTIVKSGLSAFDDKRYLVNPIDSVAYGHHVLDHNDLIVLYDETS